MPLVSVIMPVYNGQRFLAEAVESILAQTFEDFELIVVDDGSEDGSAEIIRSYQKLDNRLCLIQHERNSGQGAALNTGLAAASGSYITSMDCDDISLSQRCELQVAYLQSSPDIGAVGTCARVVYNDSKQAPFDFIVPSQHALIAFNLYFGASFVGSTVMMRSEYMEAVGGYTSDPSLNADLDFFMRLLWHTPVKFANVAEILLIYRRHHLANTVANLSHYTAAERKIRGCMLQRMWGAVPPGTVDRFQKLRFQHKLNWAERRATKRDLLRLIESFVAHNMVDPSDRPLLVAEMNRRLEQASPRRWQQFMHWRRHHFPMGKSS